MPAPGSSPKGAVIYGYFFNGGEPWWWKRPLVHRLLEPRLRRRLESV